MMPGLLVALQKGIRAELRPFASIGASIGMAEREVLAQLETAFADGTARRFGAVFDGRLLGYRSSLCALTLPDDQFDRVVPRITAHPGVTHCYLRGWPAELDPRLPGGPQGTAVPNVWFTLTGQRAEFDDACAAMRAALAPNALLDLPARRRFKIDVVFDPATRTRSERVPAMKNDLPDRSDPTDKSDNPPRFTEREKALIRCLQGSIPVVAEPFAVIARELEWDVDELLACIARWDACGIIRRIALIVRHHAIGFKANGMCVWRVAAADVEAAGRALAAHSVVTHCYERASCSAFPYNLFAMIHTGTWYDTRCLFEELSRGAGLADGRVLCSLREFKKTSPDYFSAPEVA